MEVDTAEKMHLLGNGTHAVFVLSWQYGRGGSSAGCWAGKGLGALQQWGGGAGRSGAEHSSAGCTQRVGCVVLRAGKT